MLRDEDIVNYSKIDVFRFGEFRFFWIELEIFLLNGIFWKGIFNVLGLFRFLKVC